MKITEYLIKVLALTVFLSSCTANAQIGKSDGKIWNVTKAPDGDTITAVNSFQSLKIRFCGIDAPEKAQAGGIESRDYLRSLLDKANRKVELQIIEQDKYGRSVAEISAVIDGKKVLINEEMVKAGQAYHYARYSANCPHKNAIENAESIAKSQRIGVWSNPNNIKPWDYRRTKRENRN